MEQELESTPKSLRSTILHSIREHYHQEGNLTKARSYFQEALVLDEELEDTCLFQHNLVSLGNHHLGQGDFDKTREKL